MASPFGGYCGEVEGWAEGALARTYVAFDPDILSLNDDLFNELLLAAHAIRVSCAPAADDDAQGGCGGASPLDELDEEAVDRTELASFVEAAADVFALDRPCLVCRILDVYRREYGLSALWMADYAFLCAKCLASPPCAVVTFVAAFEFAYIMDKHFLPDFGATLVGAFGRRALTLDDVQRHFLLHGCFRTDGGVPGRRYDDVAVIVRQGPGRPPGGRAGPAARGTAKVLYSNYSYLAQSATRAMMMTLTDGGGATASAATPPLSSSATASTGRGKGRRATGRREEGGGASTAAYSPSTTASSLGGGRSAPAAVASPPVRACQPSLAVALAGWKECAKSVECAPAHGRRGDSCALRAFRADDEYEAELERRAEEAEMRAIEAVEELEAARAAELASTSDDEYDDDGYREGERGERLPPPPSDYASLFPRAPPRAAPPPDAAEPPPAERAASWAYADLALLLLAGTGAAPLTPASGEFSATAARVRRETVEAYWATNRRALARDVPARYARFYEEDAAPDLDLGPVMATQLKHALTRGGTAAECLPCNMMVVREYWTALRRFKRDINTYSANNVGLFHSVGPTLEEWAERDKLGVNDGKRFVNLLRGAGPEAVYKHFFCDPMCAARAAQTDPRRLFEHPSGRPSDAEELALYKAGLASQNRFEGRICAGLWALAYAFKTHQVFPPRPTALAAFVKDAGSLLQRHSISLVSLEHTLGAYV